MSYYSLLVDDEGDSSRKKAEASLGSVEPSNLSLSVA